jgi:hypothetical protein
MYLSRRRLGELGIEILIGLAWVGAIILYATFGPLAWMPSARWWGFAANTGLLLWTVVMPYRRYWRQRSYWLNVTWLTVLHLAVWSTVLANVDEWGLLWFVPPFVVETGLAILALHKLGYAPRDSRGGAA